MLESLDLNLENKNLNFDLNITGSKSESNRLLIANALFENVIGLKNLSNSEDTQLMQAALANNGEIIDIHHAGTAMRFLTAYLATQNGRTVTLTGSQRMKERPIALLVDVLKKLGADIQYVENEGFPPLKIVGKNLQSTKVALPANISSQYISALMLIAPTLENGLEIELIGKITSLPYLEMTIQLLKKLDISVNFSEQIIKIEAKNRVENQTIAVESDWSSASYYYSYASLADQAQIGLKTYYQNSLQGDAALSQIYLNNFGVNTFFDEEKIVLKKDNSIPLEPYFEIDLVNTPDIAQTIAVTCAGQKRRCKLTGLHTLKIKETDRLVALKNELFKCGVNVEITDDTLEIVSFFPVDQMPIIETYNDHRMAMSFAPLALKFPIKILNPSVVEKSYPDFWNDYEKLK